MISYVNNKKPSMLAIYFLIPIVLHVIKSINNLFFFLSYFMKFRLNEYRDMFNEIKSRLDFEREDRRLVETQLASKYEKQKPKKKK